MAEVFVTILPEGEPLMPKNVDPWANYTLVRSEEKADAKQDSEASPDDAGRVTKL